MTSTQWKYFLTDLFQKVLEIFLKSILNFDFYRLENGVEFHSFNGIPFAEPPTKQLRFQKPVPKKPWEGILEANRHPQCLQIPINQVWKRFSKKFQKIQKSFVLKFLGMKRVQGVEDCLALSIYVPNKNESNSLLPVMVWIHGGGFAMDSGDCQLYGPDYLMNQQDIVSKVWS